MQELGICFIHDTSVDPNTPTTSPWSISGDITLVLHASSRPTSLYTRYTVIFSPLFHFSGQRSAFSSTLFFILQSLGCPMRHAGLYPLRCYSYNLLHYILFNLSISILHLYWMICVWDMIMYLVMLRRCLDFIECACPETRRVS